MDAEVRKAKAHVREREAAISNKVEQVGPQAIAAERATEKQVPKAKADEETSRARPSIGALMWQQHGAQSGCAIVPNQSPVHAGSVKERC